MKRYFLLFIAVFGLCQVASRAQTADDPNEGSRLEWDGTNSIYRFSWWGRLGRTYFIQQSEDLVSGFTYIPIIEAGDDSIKEWGFTSTGDKFFLRLKYSDISSSDPWNADFDQDGVSNGEELLLGMDPLASADSDGDRLPDWWELDSFGNLAETGLGDPDNDGMTNFMEFLFGSDPTLENTEAGATFVATGLKVFTPME
jgi:hypothetical protein